MTPGEFLARAAHYHLGIAGARREIELPRRAPCRVAPRADGVPRAQQLGRRSSTRRSADGITVAQLLARASLRLAADLDSGRAAARIWAAADRAEVA